MNHLALSDLVVSRLLYVSVYLVIPAVLCYLLTRSQETSAAFRLWVWRGFFVVSALVLVVGPVATFHLSLTSPEAAGGETGVTWLAAAPLALWTIGVAVVAIRLSLEEKRARHLLALCEPIVDRDLLALAASVSARIGLRRAVCLVSTSACKTPMVVFGRDPVIVVPDWAIATLTAEEMSEVIAHEMAHLKGRDGLWSGFQCLMTGLLWFHPVAWMASRQASIAAEMQADAVALRLSGGSPARLANTILLCVTGAQPMNAAALSGNGRKLAMRLVALEKPAARMRRRDVAGLVLALLLAVPLAPVFARPESVREPAAFSPIRIGAPVNTYTPMDAVAAPIASGHQVTARP